MKRNSTTSAGRTRWRCKDPGCGSGRTRGYGTAARDVRGFIDWLLSADTQEQRHVSARTLRRRNELGWSLWPPCPMDGQVHDVVHLDGIHLGRKAVVLIAYVGGHVIGWYVARRETGAAWMSLMARIAEPVVVVCDGGGGIRKALRHAWPGARVQRCLFHICPNIGALLGQKPRYEASRQLLRLAKELTRVKDGDAMARLAGRLQRMGDAAQGLPRAEKRVGRRQRERLAPTARQGPRHAAPAHTRAHHVHLHGPRSGHHDAHADHQQRH